MRLSKKVVASLGINITGASPNRGGNASLSIELSPLPREIQAVTKLSITNSSVQFSERNKLEVETLITTDSRIESLWTSTQTIVRSSGTSIAKCNIEGSCAAAGDAIALEKCSMGGLLISNGGAVVRSECSFDRIFLNENGWIESSREASGNIPWERCFGSRMSDLRCVGISNEGVGEMYNTQFSYEPYERDGDRKQATVLRVNERVESVYLTTTDSQTYLSDSASPPRSCVLLSRQASVIDCVLEDITLAMEPTSTATGVSGRAYVAYCESAYLESNGENRLRIYSATSHIKSFARDSPYRGASLQGVGFIISRDALPGLVALEDVALLNPWVDNLVDEARVGASLEGAAIEVLNRAITQHATLGSVKTKSAYAAGDYRARNSENLTERIVLRILSGFGFAQRPRLAFLWWLFVVLASLQCINYFGGESSQLATFAQLGHGFLALTVEPFNLFKAKTENASSIIPWTGSVMTVQRAVLTIAFGHFIVAFTRYTRVTLRY